MKRQPVVFCFKGHLRAVEVKHGSPLPLPFLAPHHLAAQQAPHRQVARLAFQIPKRQVQSSQRVDLFPPGGIEVAAHHTLPHIVDAQRVLPYQHGGASLLDFLSAQNDYRSIQLSYLNLVGSYMTAAGQMNLAVGKEVIP